MAKENNIVQLKNALSTADNPVSIAEMREFWESISEEEKESLRTMDLSELK